MEDVIESSFARSGVVKGAIGGQGMDVGCAVVHLLLAHLQADAWWEYAQSESNWSDGVSRAGERDPWLQKNGVEVIRRALPQWPWSAEADERAARLREVFKDCSFGGV